MNGLIRWADRQWLVWPRRLMARWPASRGFAGDGHVVVTVPALAAVLPGAITVVGLVAGLLRLGYEDVYTESVVLLALMIGIGAFSSQLGVLVVVGFCVGDLISAEMPAPTPYSTSPWFSGVLGEGPLAVLVHGFLPLLITYLLLTAGVVLLPRAARAVVLSVGRGRVVPPVLSWLLVSALLLVIVWLGTDAWVAGAPTLVRPLFTWAQPNGAPTVEAMNALQGSGGVVVAAAVGATLVRQLWLGATMLPGLLQDRLRAAEDSADPGDPAVPTRRTPGVVRRVTAAVATSLLATLALAGILERVWLWFAAFGVLLAVRLLRTDEWSLPWLDRWRRVASRLPAWARLLALWLMSRAVLQGVSNDLIGSYTALAVFVLVSIVVVFVVFPGEPRAASEPTAERVPVGGAS
ncbi:hypothetical protein [Cellulomonas sp. URHB0016]